MNNSLSNKYLLFFSRILLAAVFIFSGIEKIFDPENFAQSIMNYKVFPLITINIIAITIPWIEFVAGILLLFGVKVRENSFILASLLFAFTLLVIIALIRGLNIECGCFGTAHSEIIGLQKIIENIVFILLSINLVKNNSFFLSLANSSGDSQN